MSLRQLSIRFIETPTTREYTRGPLLRLAPHLYIIIHFWSNGPQGDEGHMYLQPGTKQDKGYLCDHILRLALDIHIPF